MLKRYDFSGGRVVETESANHPIAVYIHPNDDEKRFLVEQFKLDEHTLNSSLDPDELSRIEFEPDHIAMILKRPRNYSAKEKFVFAISSFGIFWSKSFLIIVISEDIPLFDLKIFSRIINTQDVALKLIYRTIFHFLDHLKIINSISDALEQKINTSMENNHLISLFTLEKSLVYYLNAINSNAACIEKLKYNANRIGFSTEHIEILDDIIIENSQCYKQAEIYSNILASLMDARASIVSNNLNVLMKTLNIITIGIMVPTFVVSAFSMNVTIPLSKNPSAFLIIMGLAAISVIIFMIIWKVRK